MATTRTTTTTTTVTTGAQAAAASHAHGDMNVRAHEKTFDGFVKFLAWNAVAIILVLIFLALVNA